MSGPLGQRHHGRDNSAKQSPEKSGSKVSKIGGATHAGTTASLIYNCISVCVCVSVSLSASVSVSVSVCLCKSDAFSCVVLEVFPVRALIVSFLFPFRIVAFGSVSCSLLRWACLPFVCV